MKYRGILGAVVILSILLTSAFRTEASEEDENGMTPFISARVGVSVYRDSDILDGAGKISPVFPYDSAYKRDGFTAGATVGIGGRFFEHQLQGDYHRSKAENSASGLRVMSVLYQPTVKIPVRKSWFYLGFGIGAAQGKTAISGKLDGIYCAKITRPCPEDSIIKWNLPISGVVDDWEFAYQLSAGFVYALTDRIGLELGYRYLGTTRFDVQRIPHYDQQTPPIMNPGTPPTPCREGCVPDGITFMPDLLTEDLLSFGANEVTFGLRYQFH